LKFLEAAHIKDIVAILRWAENPRDQVAGLRVLKLVPGIGAATARRALGVISATEQGFAALATFTPPPASREAWTGLMPLMSELAGSKEWKAEI
jgi:DNA helicase-2/ATP-dependent DNA helicase PcrA